MSAGLGSRFAPAWIRPVCVRRSCFETGGLNDAAGVCWRIALTAQGRFVALATYSAQSASSDFHRWWQVCASWRLTYGAGERSSEHGLGRDT